MTEEVTEMSGEEKGNRRSDRSDRRGDRSDSMEDRGVRSYVVGKNKIVTLTMRVNAHDVSLIWQDDVSGKFVMS